jgi:hypothetical protein
MTQATTRRHVDRQALGQELVALGCVRQVGKSSWLVLSPKSGHAYLVDRRRDPWGSYDRWECSCPDHHYRHTICKHIRAVKAYLGIDDPTPWPSRPRRRTRMCAVAAGAGFPTPRVCALPAQRPRWRCQLTRGRGCGRGLGSGQAKCECVAW